MSAPAHRCLPADDFPSFARSMHELKRSDATFAHGLRAYEALDERMGRIEQGTDSCRSGALEALQRRLARLGRELHARVRAHAHRRCR